MVSSNQAIRSGILTAAMAALLPAGVNGEMAVERTDNGVEIQFDGKRIATYVFRDDAIKRPYFANIKSLAGLQVTRHHPPRKGVDSDDHATMHPGIFLAFGDISGSDFWRNKARVVHDGFTAEPRVSGSRVTFTVRHRYVAGDEPVCVEICSHTIEPVQDGFRIAFDSRFSNPEREFTFGDQEEMGFGVRVARELRVDNGSGTILNSDGLKNGRQAWGKQADWCDYSGVVGGHEVGVLVMPHPDNFRRSWFHARDYGLLAANPFGRKAFTRGDPSRVNVERGQELRLRFAAVVHSTPENQPFDCGAAYRAYVKPSGSDAASSSSGSASPWRRHTIDESSRGADGVRLADINADGLLDAVTGWEEGGQIRVCLHPGRNGVKRHWPSVVVGRVRSPEDAVFADVDGDGAFDVVSSCEGSERTVFVHWGPKSAEDMLQPDAWATSRLEASFGKQQWMFCLPMQIDGRNGIDLICGSKGNRAEVGWFQSPADPRDTAAWKWHSICQAGWIMSLIADDVDDDGDNDVIITDRKGPNRGVHWLENPGGNGTGWTSHAIGGRDREMMFATIGDVDRDGMDDIVCNVKGGDIVWLRRTGQAPADWEEHTIRQPSGSGSGKGIAVADLDGDGASDLVLTCEHAVGKVGAFRLSFRDSPFDVEWEFHDISGREEGVKFDLIRLADLDLDGDQDVLTCEERDNLGVIWYENPSVP